MGVFWGRVEEGGALGEKTTPLQVYFGCFLCVKELFFYQFNSLTY
jgi:hypothetical protein